MASIGTYSQLGMGSASPVTEAFEFISETLKKVSTHYHSPGIRGTRSRHKSRVRETREAIAGSITMEPTPTEIDNLIERILGGTTAVGVTDVADTLPEFYVEIDRIAKVFEYSGCRVSRAVFSGSSGNPLQLVLDIEGETETVGNAGTAASLSLPTDNIFVFSDIVLTLESAAREVSDFTLTIDNLLDADRYMNSLTRDEIYPLDREVTLACTVPYTTANTALYDAAIAGAAGSLVIADGSTTYTIDFANLKIPAESPEVPGKEEINLALNLASYADDSNSECKFTKT